MKIIELNKSQKSTRFALLAKVDFNSAIPSKEFLETETSVYTVISRIKNNFMSNLKLHKRETVGFIEDMYKCEEDFEKGELTVFHLNSKGDKDWVLIKIKAEK